MNLSPDELLIRFLEEGAPLSMASRASGIDIRVLQHLPLSRTARAPTKEELGELSARVSRKALETLEDDMERGGPAVRLRAATAVAGHPLRRMTTDTSAEKAEMIAMMENMLAGRAPEEEIEVEEEG